MELKKRHFFIITINLIVCICSIVIAKNIVKPAYSYSTNEKKQTVSPDFDSF